MMADNRGPYTPVKSKDDNPTGTKCVTAVIIVSDRDKMDHNRRTKDGNRKFTVCVTFGIVVSVGLLIAETFCLVKTVQSINDLQNLEIQNSPPTSSSLRSPFQLPTVPCNKTLSCFVVEDDTYSKMVKLFTGAKRQMRIRQENKGNKNRFGYLTRQNCEQFSVSNCSDNKLDWRSDFHGNKNETDGSIIISQNGTYGMYTSFTLKCPYDKSINKTVITHRLHRQRQKGTSEVLFERKVVLKPQSQAFRTSSLLEYVDLHEGERVYPSLSNTSFIFRSSKANTWGVYLIR